MSNRVWEIRGYLEEPMHGEGETAREAVLWALDDRCIEDEVMEAATWGPVRFECRPWCGSMLSTQMEEVILRANTVVYEVTKWEDQ